GCGWRCLGPPPGATAGVGLASTPQPLPHPPPSAREAGASPASPSTSATTTGRGRPRWCGSKLSAGQEMRASDPDGWRSGVGAEGLGDGCLKTCTPASEEGKTRRPVYLNIMHTMNASQ